MTKYQFSIIIPHKNIPNLLQRCLNSIPVRDDVQVIVVDDNSSPKNVDFDNFPGVNQLNTIVIFDKSNRGAGHARNLGLNRAEGKWVIFLDSDDLLVDNANDILNQSVNRSEDVLFYNYRTVYSDDLSREGTRIEYQGFFKEYKEYHDDNLFRYWSHSLWGKIIRIELLEKYNIRCDETKYSNDVGLSIKIGVHAQSIAIIDMPFFIITQRAGSLASSQFSKIGPSIGECRERLSVAYSSQAYLDKYHIKLKYNLCIPLVYEYRRHHKFFIYLFSALNYLHYPRTTYQICRYLYHLIEIDVH